MPMCGGPSRRSRAICAETGSVTSAGRAPRGGGEGRGEYAGSVGAVWLHGDGLLEVVGSDTHEAKPDSADATTWVKTVSGGMRLKCKSQRCGCILSGFEWRRCHAAAA